MIGIHFSKGPSKMHHETFHGEIGDNASISPVTPMPEVRRAKFLVVFFCL